MFQTKAKVQVKNTQGVVIASQEYDKVVFEGTALNDKGKVIVGEGVTPEQLLGATIAYYQAQVGEKGNGVLAMLADNTYAHDLGRRASMRQTLVTAAAGPDKAIEKAIKDFMAARAAAGKPVTEEAARAKMLALMAD
jgi:hypothetical protein